MRDSQRDELETPEEATVLAVTNLSLAEKRIAEAMDGVGHLILAADARKAEEALRGTERIDLAFLDDDMPGKDGERTLERIRTEGNEIPVMMFSDRPDSERVLRCFALGADDYVEFPIGAVLLRLRIRAILRRSGK